MRFERVTSKRKILNFQSRCRIIELRFGTYGGQFTYPIMRVGEIAKQMGLRHDTVTYHCKRYVKNGGFLMAHPERMPHRRGPMKMTKEAIDHITNPTTLRSWSHLNLAERCELLKYDFGVDIRRQTLGWWYHRNGITWARP